MEHYLISQTKTLKYENGYIGAYGEMIFKGNFWIFPIQRPKYHTFSYLMGKYITANNVLFLCIITFLVRYKKCVLCSKQN